MKTRDGNGRTQKTKANGGSRADAPEGLASLMYQLLETEMGGVQVYRTALQCVIRQDLREEWQKYLAETERHVTIARALVEAAGLDPDAEVPARLVVRHLGASLVEAMLEALAAGTPAEAQITAAECVIKAETKDHMNWGLIGVLADRVTGDIAGALRTAHQQVEAEEDRHLYHTQGWARELWLESMGLEAVFPPPEEKRDVASAGAAEKAKKERLQAS